MGAIRVCALRPRVAGKVKKSRVLPDQSMSIKEIVRRYVRGIPIDVVQREPVYLDQSEHDMEKLSRMDFGEKAEYAQVMAAEAERIKAEHNEAVRRSEEERVEKARLQSERAEAAKKASESKPA